MPENTALIDEIMAALDAENSTNVELIVRNTQNGATKKMPLASLEQIIYNYLTSSSVAAQLASVLGVVNHGRGEISDLNSFFIKGIHTCEFWDPLEMANLPSGCVGYGICVSIQEEQAIQFVTDYLNHLWFRTKEGASNIHPWVQLA